MRRTFCLTSILLAGVSATSLAAETPDQDALMESLRLKSCEAIWNPELHPEEFEDSVVVTGSRIRQASPQMMAMPEMAAQAPLPSPSLSLAPAHEFAPTQDTSRFDNGEQNTVKRTLSDPVSTFSADVDTAAYAVMRRHLRDCEMPPSESVRVEEYINSFDYGYDLPVSAEEPFKPDVEIFPSPWNDNADLLRVGIKGYDLVPDEQPSANIVLLLDVSGSMNAPDKLPLLKDAMKILVEQLDEDDRVSIVVYAGAAGAVLEPTSGRDKDTIIAALDELRAGGSTAGGQGLALAYDLAEQNFDPDAVNRIILATDGDFNVGVTGDAPLTDFVSRKREEGIYLSVLGFGRGNFNDQMMQAIAQNGNGIAAYIDSVREAERVLGREFSSSIFPIANDVKFQVEFNPASIAEYRLIGYQTRLLNEEDFDNDAVDAGEVGSGHSVTALYEIIRRGEEGWLPERRYDEQSAPDYDPRAEIAYLKIRYKLPNADESLLIERAITRGDRVRRFSRASEDSRFAAMVSAFAEKLARTTYISDDFGYDEIADYVEEAIGEDEFGDRAEFLLYVSRLMEIVEHDRKMVEEDEARLREEAK